MINLSDDDFRPLTDFELLSRWTRTDNQISTSVLNLIHPLTHEKAKELWIWLSISTGELGSYLFNPNAQAKPDSLFATIEQHTMGN